MSILVTGFKICKLLITAPIKYFLVRRNFQIKFCAIYLIRSIIHTDDALKNKTRNQIINNLNLLTF